MNQNIKSEIMSEIRKLYIKDGYKRIDNLASVRNLNIFQNKNVNDLHEGLQALIGLSFSIKRSFEENIG